MTDRPLTRQITRRTFRSFFPIIDWLPKYESAWLRPDLIAALTVWALVVPEAMAYAGIAGMPPEVGLYAAPLALIGYAIFGTSRHLNVGPSSTVAALSFSVVAAFAVAGSDDFIDLTITLAIITGILLILAGIARLGILADFFSKPVLDGFVVGVAITIVVGQLDKLLGYEVEALDFIPDILVIIRDIGSTHWPTLLIGLISLALLFLIERFIPKLPGAITVLFLAIIISAVLDFEALGIHVVGDIPAGLPDIGLPDVSLPEIVTLLPGAAAIALVAFAESVATARTYASRFNYKIEPDQELIALGAANTGAGISQGFVVDGSLSKTAASVEAGAKSQMVSLIAAVAVLVTAAALTPLFRTLPEATLGAIVIHAVWHLITFRKLRSYRQITSIDFWTAMVALGGVLLLGILEGLILAVGLGLLVLLIGTKFRTTSILGKVPGENVYRGLENFPEGETFPGLLILRFGGSLYFANAPDFADEVRYGIELTEPKPKVVLVDGEAINGIDATAIHMLHELHDELDRDGVRLYFARVRGNVYKVMHRTDFVDLVGEEHFYVSIQAAVDEFLAGTDHSPQSEGYGQMNNG
ncbi:MAG: sulfate permease [Anaerolineales bacterium]|nr:sulfate permease [Anaerolineales bacterium]